MKINQKQDKDSASYKVGSLVGAGIVIGVGAIILVGIVKVIILIWSL